MKKAELCQDVFYLQFRFYCHTTPPLHASDFCDHNTAVSTKNGVRIATHQQLRGSVCARSAFPPVSHPPRAASQQNRGVSTTFPQTAEDLVTIATKTHEKRIHTYLAARQKHPPPDADTHCSQQRLSQEYASHRRSGTHSAPAALSRPHCYQSSPRTYVHPPSHS